jgi:hypothetical protein
MCDGLRMVLRWWRQTDIGSQQEELFAKLGCVCGRHAHSRYDVCNKIRLIL